MQFIIEWKARRSNYRHVVSLNFEKNSAYRAIFDGDLDAESIIKQISLRVPRAELVPGETLLFLDEIQSCPRARVALKFLTQDARFDVIAPKHLAKDYKKFQYSIVERGGTARKFGGSLMWLMDAGIIQFCYNLTIPELPLEGNARSDAFKVYMRDTGLLMAMLEEGSQEDIIDGNLGIYKGAIYENIIADIFGKAGKKLYYFEQNGKIEVDFFLRRHKIATAIEVKSADNTKSKSMETILTRYGVKHGIKLSAKNVGGTEDCDSFPLYMAMFL